MSLRRTSLAMLLAAGVSCCASAEDREVLRRSFLGRPSPELVFQEEDWLGESRSTSLAELKGKVVWLQFNF